MRATAVVSSRAGEQAKFSRMALLKAIRIGLESYIRNVEVFLVPHALYARPSRGVVVKVSLHGSRTDEWDSVVLETFSRASKLDSQTIRFDRVLEVDLVNLPDFISGINGNFEESASLAIRRNCGVEDWHVARPKTIQPLTVAVEEYVTFWGKQATNG